MPVTKPQSTRSAMAWLSSTVALAEPHSSHLPICPGPSRLAIFAAAGATGSVLDSGSSAPGTAGRHAVLRPRIDPLIKYQCRIEHDALLVLGSKKR